MMRLVRKSLLTLCSLLLAVSVLIPQTTVHAADQKWMNQVWSEYKSYHKKTVNAITITRSKRTRNISYFMKQAMRRWISWRKKCWRIKSSGMRSFKLIWSS